MRAIIDAKMKEVWHDLVVSTSRTKLCELKTIRWDTAPGPDYSSQVVQQLYLLRYYPAYLCEYRYLYKQVLASGRLANLNVFTVGCGCCIDHSAAYLALGKDLTRLVYCGVDPAPWGYLDSLENPSFEFARQSIGDVRLGRALFNVLFFPKSLTEIPEGAFGSFLANLGKCRLMSPAIFLMSSVMDKNFQRDECRYGQVADVLKASGYACADYTRTQEVRPKGKGLNQIDPEFKYPDDVLAGVKSFGSRCITYRQKGRSCGADCQQLNRSPILTSTYMSYQLNCFARAR